MILFIASGSWYVLVEELEEISTIPPLGDNHSDKSTSAF
jgi:hypothetical protein